MVTSPAIKKTSSAFGQIWFILRYSGRFFWATNKWVFLGLMLINSIESFIIFPNLLLDKLFFDTLVDNIGHDLNRELLTAVFSIVLVRFALASFKSLSKRLSGYFGRMFQYQIFQKLEVDLGRKYATISVPTLEDPKFKDRYQKIERESLQRLHSVGESYVRIPQYLTGIISSLAIFVATQPFVVLFSLLSLVPTIVVDQIFIKRSYELETRISLIHRFRGMYYYLLGRTRSYLESRLLNVHDYLSDKVNKYWQEIIDARLDLQRKKRAGDYFAGLVDDLVSYTFDAVFAVQTLLGRITLGTLQAYIRAIANFKTNVSSLTVAVMDLYENYLYISDLVWFFNLENPYFNDIGKKFPQVSDLQISFNDVWFRYPGSENWILRGITFSISPHENIALIGKNGAGKTTLVKLLCGFYEPTKGSITINGVSVSELNKQDYWRNLSILFQDFETYPVTARESISISDIRRVADTKSVRKYAQLTEISDWIESLPRKYESALTRDFEAGVNPSSGQWQRIGIARALFKESPILVLDEPTSNVDPEAEENIFNQILTIGRQKIIIFISHRFSTVRKAGKIIVIEQGRVMENGFHSQLMSQKGIYARLFALQAKNYR